MKGTHSLHVAPFRQRTHRFVPHRGAIESQVAVSRTAQPRYLTSCVVGGLIRSTIIPLEASGRASRALPVTTQVPIDRPVLYDA